MNVASLQRQRPRVPRRRRGRLSTLLARTERAHYAESMLDRFKESKVEAAERDFAAAAIEIHSTEQLAFRVKMLWKYSLQALGLLCALGLSLTLVGWVIGSALLIMSNARFTIGFFLAGPVVLVLSLLAFVFVQNVCGAIAGLLERSCTRRAVKAPRLQWRTMRYDCYVARYPVPDAVRETVAEVSAKLPDASFEVEYTFPTEYPGLNKPMWDYNPDPILWARLGGECFALEVWDEIDFEPGATYLH